MKLRVRSWAAVTGAFALLAVSSCSIERRSPAFVCELESDCDPGLTCDQGWCVPRPGDASVTMDSVIADANGDSADTGSAPADAYVCNLTDCTSCDLDGTCVIGCAGAGSCAAPVVCPPGIPCKVECSGDSSCGGGIDCSAASSCRIECTNTATCTGQIACGLGVCRVECGGADSCTGGIACDTSCLCDTFCTGAGSCTVPPVCPGPQQCTSGIDCTSAPGPCNSC